jgi:hypothetical protein
MTRGVHLGVDFVLTHRSKPYVNGKLFLDYINSIFIHYLNELWQSEEFAECEAVLLMANFSPHMGDAMIAILTREHVRVITFAPHTTHIFQVLDLVLFGALKNIPLVSARLTKSNQPPHSSSRSITISNRQWWKSTSGALFQPSVLAMTSAMSHMNCSSMRKRSGKAEASSNFGNATCQWTVCRGEGNKQGLAGSTNENKSIWSIVFVFWIARNEDMMPTI